MVSAQAHTSPTFRATQESFADLGSRRWEHGRLVRAPPHEFACSSLTRDPLLQRGPCQFVERQLEARTAQAGGRDTARHVVPRGTTRFPYADSLLPLLPSVRAMHLAFTCSASSVSTPPCISRARTPDGRHCQVPALNLIPRNRAPRLPRPEPSAHRCSPRHSTTRALPPPTASVWPHASAYVHHFSSIRSRKANQQQRRTAPGQTRPHLDKQPATAPAPVRVIAAVPGHWASCQQIPPQQGRHPLLTQVPGGKWHLHADSSCSRSSGWYCFT